MCATCSKVPLCHALGIVVVDLDIRGHVKINKKGGWWCAHPDVVKTTSFFGLLRIPWYGKIIGSKMKFFPIIPQITIEYFTSQSTPEHILQVLLCSLIEWRQKQERKKLFPAPYHHPPTHVVVCKTQTFHCLFDFYVAHVNFGACQFRVALVSRRPCCNY